MVMGHIAPLDFMQMRTGFETGDEAGLFFFLLAGQVLFDWSCLGSNMHLIPAG